MCDRGKCCVARRHGLYWLRMWPRMCTEVVQIWSWVQARFDRYYHRAVFSCTVDAQNSEPSPPTPIFKVERDPASASIQITIKHNFENWGTGGVVKNTRTYNNWYKSKSKCCGLRILSIYVRPFRDHAPINVLIWFLPSVFFVALVMAMGIGHAFLHSLSYSRTIRIGSL